MMALMWPRTNLSQDWLLLLSVVLLFGTLGGILLVMALRYQITVLPQGIEYRGLVEAFVPWKYIQSVEINHVGLLILHLSRPLYQNPLANRLSRVLGSERRFVLSTIVPTSQSYRFVMAIRPYIPNVPVSDSGIRPTEVGFYQNSSIVGLYLLIVVGSGSLFYIIGREWNLPELWLFSWRLASMALMGAGIGGVSEILSYDYWLLQPRSGSEVANRVFLIYILPITGWLSGLGLALLVWLVFQSILHWPTVLDDQNSGLLNIVAVSIGMLHLLIFRRLTRRNI